MAEPTYTYYIDAYIQDHRNRFNAAIEMAASEKAAALEQEKLIRDYIVDLQNQRTDLVKALDGGDPDRFGDLIKYNSLVERADAKAIDDKNKQISAVRKQYTELPVSTATNIVSNIDNTLSAAAPLGLFDQEAVKAAEQSAAALGDTSEGQRLLAARNFVNTYNTKAPTVNSSVDNTRIRQIARDKFGLSNINDIDNIDVFMDEAIAALPPIQNSLSRSARQEMREAGGFDEPAAAVEEVKVEGVAPTKEIDDLIAQAQEQLLGIETDKTKDTMARAREIYQAEFSPVRQRDRRAARAYDSLNTEEKQIAKSLSMQFSESSYDKAVEEAPSIATAAEQYAQQLKSPKADFDVYSEMRKLLQDTQGEVNEDYLQLAMRKGIEEYKKSLPKEPARPAGLRGMKLPDVGFGGVDSKVPGVTPPVTFPTDQDLMLPQQMEKPVKGREGIAPETTPPAGSFGLMYDQFGNPIQSDEEKALEIIQAMLQRRSNTATV
jgi:hypothetical protein